MLTLLINRLIHIFIGFNFIIGLQANEIPLIMVSADKEEISLDESISNIDYYSKSDIEQSSSITLVDFLEEKANFQVRRSGEFGGVAGLSFRGLNTGFYKILINDTEVYDPSSPGSSFQIQNILLNQIESIEILKGAQTLLYGTSAVAGIIKINTFKNQDNYLKVSYGSNQTFQAATSYTKRLEDSSLSLSASSLRTQGISQYSLGEEKDSFRNIQLFTAYKKEFKKSEIGFNFFNINKKEEIDNFKEDLINDDIQRVKQRGFSIQTKGYGLLAYWQYHLLLNHFETKRTSEINSSTFRGRTFQVELRNNFLWSENSKTNLFIQSINDKSESLSELKSNALSLNHYLKIGRFKASIGGRFEKWDTGTKALVYKVALSYHLYKNLILKFNEASIFKSPTIFQLHSDFGNKNLKNAKGYSQELSLEYKENSLSVYKTRIRDEINYSFFIKKYENIEDSKVTGVELKLKKDFSKNSHLTFKYTNLDISKKNNPNARELIGLTFNKNLLENLSFSYSQRFVSRNPATDFSPELKSYLLSSLSFNYKENLDYTLRIHNLFNRKYESNYSYKTRGLSFYLDVKYVF